MTLAAINAAIRELEANWNGLDMVPAMEIRALSRERDELTRAMFGCCGRPQWLNFEIHCGGTIEKVTEAHCPLDGRVCQRAHANALRTVFAILNSHQRKEPMSATSEYKRVVNTISLITQDQLAQVTQLDDTIRQTTREVAAAHASGNQMLKAITMARGMAEIRRQITPLMPALMELMGSPLGFTTDKDKPRYDEDKKQWDNSKYSADEVRDALIVGLLSGFKPVGNEIGIISRGFYALKNGLRRVVLDYPGLANLRIEFGVPEQRPAGALVPALITWTVSGKPDRLECRESKLPDGTDQDTRICVRVNRGQGVDAILGKAERKAYARVYAILTGMEVRTEDDLDEEPIPDENTLEILQPVDPMDVVRDGIAAAKKPGEPTRLFNTLFGPDSVREWTPEQHDEASRLTTQRESELYREEAARKGSRGQRQLNGVS